MAEIKNSESDMSTSRKLSLTKRKEEKKEAKRADSTTGN